MHIMRGTVLTVLAAGLLAVPAFAQEPGTSDLLDNRWIPWIGCWELPLEQLQLAAGAEPPFLDETTVCMTPTADRAGVRLVTRRGDDILVERTLVADNSQHDVTQGDCTGWEQRDWSADGLRLYSRAELRCGGEAQVRRTSGLSLISGRSTWIDLQLIETEDRQHLEIRRYTPAPDHPLDDETPSVDSDRIEQARRRAGESPTLSAVRDAAERIDTRIVEAMLTETQPRLAVDAAAVIALDEAGIDDSIIDLLIALAHPENFVVERRRTLGRSTGQVGWWSRDPRRYGQPRWFNLTPYYTTPLGGYYPPARFLFYEVEGSSLQFVDVGEAGVSEIANQAPRAVKGLGYTRIRERAAAAKPAVGSDGSGGSTAIISAADSSDGSSGAVATPDGYSSGGGDVGRTAVPRR